jgi:enamine deaminase RidA (YjgF/YER057c/UK114 family)
VNTLKTNIAPVLPAAKHQDAASTGLPQVLQPAGWPAPKGYANGMMAEGRMVVTGGVIGWDSTGNFPDSFLGQVEQTLANIVEILAVAGARPEHLIRLTWYVVDIEEYTADLRALGQAYRKVVGPHYPAMAVVQVVRLVEKAARVEIEATAVISG